MEKRDLLKSVLQNFINDKPDEAKADFHQYLTIKSKEITGLGNNSIISQTSESDNTPADVDVQDADPALNAPAE